MIDETGDMIIEDGPRNPVTPMPGEIAAAICEVMGNVDRVAKDNENNFDRYKYASVDDFYAMVGPIMAKAGLIILSDEESVATIAGKKGNPWLWCRVVFYLFHRSGKSWLHPTTRHISVPANGAQAFGSYQSYAEKQFMRGLFKIPTGDEDADEGGKDDMPKPPNGNEIISRVNESTDMKALNKTLKEIVGFVSQAPRGMVDRINAATKATAESICSAALKAALKDKPTLDGKRAAMAMAWKELQPFPKGLETAMQEVKADVVAGINSTDNREEPEPDIGPPADIPDDIDAALADLVAELSEVDAKQVKEFLAGNDALLAVAATERPAVWQDIMQTVDEMKSK